MNRLQKELILKFLFLCSLLTTLYYFFWAAIYQFAWFDKPWTLAFSSSALNWVFLTLCVCGTSILWLLKDHPELVKLPQFQSKKAKTTKKKAPEKEEKDQLPLW